MKNQSDVVLELTSTQALALEQALSYYLDSDPDKTIIEVYNILDDQITKYVSRKLERYK